MNNILDAKIKVKQKKKKLKKVNESDISIFTNNSNVI